jgi:hypothetical protein
MVEEYKTEWGEDEESLDEMMEWGNNRNKV